MSEQLRAAQASTSATIAGMGGGGGGGSRGLVDSRLLGKPEAFSSDAARWRDFKLVSVSYCGAINPRLSELMEDMRGREQIRLHAEREHRRPVPGES